MGMAALGDHQHQKSGDDQHQAEQLAHPHRPAEDRQVKEVQTVGAQALDPEPAHAVPDEIEAGVLPVEGPGLGHHQQDQQQPHEVPQALVQESGVDLDVLGGGGPKPHPPGQGGLPAEGLPVHEVAPAAHGLSDEETHDPQVRKGPGDDLLPFAEEDQHDKGRDHRPVDGHAAVPDPQHGGVIQRAVGAAVAIQIEDHIVQPGPDDAQGDLPDHHVVYVVRRDAVPLPLTAAEQHRQQQAQADDDSVPVDPVANVDGHRVRIDLPVPEEAGKADGHIASRVHGRFLPIKEFWGG